LKIADWRKVKATAGGEQDAAGRFEAEAEMRLKEKRS